MRCWPSTVPPAATARRGSAAKAAVTVAVTAAAVTAASLDYEGSLTIDSSLMKRVGLLPFERVLCSNLRNGNRFETYAIPGAPGSGRRSLDTAGITSR